MFFFLCVLPWFCWSFSIVLGSVQFFFGRRYKGLAVVSFFSWNHCIPLWRWCPCPDTIWCLTVCLSQCFFCFFWCSIIFAPCIWGPFFFLGFVLSIPLHSPSQWFGLSFFSHFQTLLSESHAFPPFTFFTAPTIFFHLDHCGRRLSLFFLSWGNIPRSPPVPFFSFFRR